MSAQRDLDQLRRELSDRERELHAAVVRLQGAARRSLRPEEWVRRRPLAMAGGAFLVGWLLGRR
ncbi:MAG: hypothetical protein HKP27_06285 [Myxococcales bacterium]|nr:hypothetical protein [Myxococcales bacterium]